MKKRAATRNKPSATPPSRPSGPVTLHLLSDSTGNLAQHMLAAFLTQFPDGAFIVRRQNFLSTEAKLRQAMAGVEQHRGIVLHAVVHPEYKQIIQKQCRSIGSPHCDLTGQFVDFLARESGIAPKPDIDTLHETGGAYTRRIAALEFTLAHDDGLGLETIDDAQVVLVGVSRTSKTPTSIFLAQQGYRVSNVSLALGIEPPRELLALRSGVVGLIINARQLEEIRTNRSVAWHMGDTNYSNPRHIAEELAWCRRLFSQRGWPVLDVTDRAIEETAARIVEMLRLDPPGRA